MKHLKVKLTTLSVLAMLAISVFITSCQKDGVTNEDTLTPFENISSDTDAVTDEANYIVVFKANTKDRENELQLLEGKTREETIEITDRIRADFRKMIDKRMVEMKISTDKLNDYYSFIDGVNMTLTSKEAEKLEENPLVESIEIDAIVEVEFPEPEIVDELPVNDKDDNNKSAANDYWGCQNNLNGGYYWAGYQKSTWIWIIDTGIDLDHPELNVITNGYYARSFVGGSPDDCHGHGTHVAGIAAAKAGNGGMVGMSAGAWLVPVRIMGCSGGYPNSRLISALDHIYWRGKYGDVVNMSIGGPGYMYSALKNALDRVNNKGIFMAIAAGNDSNWVGNYIPASYNNYRALTVASMSCNNTFSSFSNYGRSSIDYIAAGENTLSTYKYGQYARMSGTSMAAPVVAGIVHARANFPKTYNYVWHNGESYPRAGLW